MTVMSVSAFQSTRRRRRGIAYVLALVLLALCTSLAVAMSASTNLSLRRGDNLHAAMNAQLAAESGLEFMILCIADAKLPKDTDYDSLMPNLAQALGDVLNDTTNLNGAPVSNTTATAIVPSIAVEGAVFSCLFTRLAPGGAGHQRCRVSIAGTAGGIRRRVSVNLKLQAKPPLIFDYGVASKGTIDIRGNAKIMSMSEAEDASIFSASGATTVIDASGNATIAGDLYTCAEDFSAIDLCGNVKVGGESDKDEILEHHTHLGLEEPEFPELDLEPYPALTTTVIDASTPTSGNRTFDNPHILPGTNPTFSGNTTLNGIVYIEAPNDVKFAGNVILNGFIVTSDGGSLPLSGNQITFTGNVSVPGVDALPDILDFADVKEYTGTAILAPGFGVTFGGNNSGINGLLAADQFTFRGNSTLGGELTGMILGLKDLPMSLRGNTTITINRPDDDYTPTGFKYSAVFEVIPGTYAEILP